MVVKNQIHSTQLLLSLGGFLTTHHRLNFNDNDCDACFWRRISFVKSEFCCVVYSFWTVVSMVSIYSDWVYMIFASSTIFITVIAFFTATSLIWIKCIWFKLEWMCTSKLECWSNNCNYIYSLTVSSSQFNLHFRFLMAEQHWIDQNLTSTHNLYLVIRFKCLF